MTDEEAGMSDGKAAQIRELVLFRDCSPREIERVCSWADMVDVPAGRVLAIRGETAREFAVVMSGAAAAIESDSEVVLGPGAFFGHTALLDHGVQPYTVETTVRTRLLVFGAREFRATLDHMPSVARKVLSDLATRLRDVNQPEVRLRAVS